MVDAIPTNRITPNHIEELEPNHIFTFGSNLLGRNGAGAALTAERKWGAVGGNPFGLRGRTFAIPTKDRTVRTTLPLLMIKPYVRRYIEFCKKHPEWTFQTTDIGCGLAGYTAKQIAPLFKDAIDVPNINLHISFWEVLING